MKQVILMRHAKSDWSAGGASDHDRRLNPRGRRAAENLGDWLRAHDLLPDQVLSSSSARTGETCALLALPSDTKVTFTRELYLASVDEILKVMRKATGNTLLMIGHNPGIAWAAAQIVAEPPHHPQFDHYPTGATLVAELDINSWQDADWEKAIARHFVVPREL